jgi:hypothetical protein
LHTIIQKRELKNKTERREELQHDDGAKCKTKKMIKRTLNPKKKVKRRSPKSRTKNWVLKTNSI